MMMDPSWSTPYTEVQWKGCAPDFPNGLPKAKLMLINADVGLEARIAAGIGGGGIGMAESYYAQFNPTELSGRISVTAGRLRPIGSSGPVKNYSSTDEAQFPLKLFFSSLAMKTWPPGLHNRGFANAGTHRNWVDARAPVRWLSSFCYTEEWGGAPPRLRLLLRNTLRVVVTVDEIEWKYTLWDNDMVPRIAEVDLKLSEIFNGGHYSRENARIQGWEKRSFIGAKQRPLRFVRTG